MSTAFREPAELAADVPPVWNKSDGHSHHLRRDQATASEKTLASGEHYAGCKLHLPTASFIRHLLF